MAKFTVFCQEKGATTDNTTFIEAVEADTAPLAAAEGRKVCAGEWQMPEQYIKVLGGS